MGFARFLIQGLFIIVVVFHANSSYAATIIEWYSAGDMVSKCTPTVVSYGGSCFQNSGANTSICGGTGAWTGWYNNANNGNSYKFYKCTSGFNPDQCPAGSGKTRAEGTGECVCPVGQEDVGGVCVTACPSGEVRNADGTCPNYPPCDSLCSDLPYCHNNEQGGSVQGYTGPMCNPPDPTCLEHEHLENHVCVADPPTTCPEHQHNPEGNPYACEADPIPTCPSGQHNNTNDPYLCESDPPPTCPEGQHSGTVNGETVCVPDDTGGGGGGTDPNPDPDPGQDCGYINGVWTCVPAGGGSGGGTGTGGDGGTGTGGDGGTGTGGDGGTGSGGDGGTGTGGDGGTGTGGTGTGTDTGKVDLSKVEDYTKGTMDALKGVGVTSNIDGPGSGAADGLYKATDKTWSSVYQGFLTEVQSKPIYQAVSHAFDVDFASCGCPVFTADVGAFGTITFDQICSEVVTNTVLPVVASIMSFVGALIAIRLAFF